MKLISSSLAGVHGILLARCPLVALLVPSQKYLSLLPEPSLTLETGIHENSLKNLIRS